LITRNYYYLDKNTLLDFINKYKFQNEKNLLVQIFSSVLDTKVLQTCLDDILDLLPQAKVIGATTDGEILENRVTTNRIVISITSFERASIKVAHVKNNHDSFSCGKELAQKIVTQKTKAMILFSDGLSTNGEFFLNGVMEVAKDIPISGGMAGDGATFNTTYIISNDGISSYGAVGISINADTLHVETAYSFNWQEVGNVLTITKAVDNRVYEINGISAVEMYSKYLGVDIARLLPSTGIEFPLILQRNGVKIARAALGKEDDGSLIFAGNLSDGDKVYIGYGNSELIINNSVHIKEKFSSKPVESIFIYSCMARRRFLKDDILLEIEPLASMAPTSGFFTYGEFFKAKKCELLNQTMTILAMSEDDSVINPDYSREIVSDIIPLGANQTQKALAHLLVQTSLELKENNKNLVKLVKHKTNELETKVAELEHASKVKSDFLANMSHEVRTPLNAILGFVDILKASETDKEKQKRFNIIKNAGATLLTVINDILDFSKIESGKMTLERKKFRTKKPFKDIGLLFYERAKEESIDLKFHFSSDLPTHFIGDIIRIKQVVSNFLSNAIKFTPKNGVIDMFVEFDNDKDELILRVKDSGIGIEKKNLAKIFESFSQADDTTTRRFGGTGLGLSISFALINSMNGRINVNSEIGVGSEFSFYLPLLKLEKSDEAQNVIPKKIDLNKQIDAKVLLVEDNKTNQMLMNILLSDIGIDIDLAENGFEAVEKFKANRYDLILMDENMPRMSGIEATKIILDLEKKTAQKHTPIVALTANALATDRAKFLSAGMDEFISKPVDQEQFIGVLHSFLLS